MDLPLCVRRWDPVSPAPWAFPEWVCLSIPGILPNFQRGVLSKKEIMVCGN